MHSAYIGLSNEMAVISFTVLNNTSHFVTSWERFNNTKRTASGMSDTFKSFSNHLQDRSIDFDQEGHWTEHLLALWRHNLKVGNLLYSWNQSIFTAEMSLGLISREVVRLMSDHSRREVFALSNTGVVGSNPTCVKDVCVRVFSVCAVMYACSGFATGWSPVQGVHTDWVKDQETENRPNCNKGL
jgi:hypothetical protein